MSPLVKNTENRKGRPSMQLGRPFFMEESIRPIGYGFYSSSIN
jgi:hypothetical protein